MPVKPNITQQLLIVLFIFFAVALPRFYYVNSFAVTLPFWDQWDAEGDFLLRPWIENTLKTSDLWSLHNEHRILPTRLLSLFIFQITGEWNNLTEARFNILLAAAAPTVLVWIFFKNRSFSGLRWLLIPVILAQFALPFSFENLFIGFQSQFYFLILFSVISILLITYLPENGYAFAAVFLLCLLSIFTMGSGFITPFTIVTVYILDLYLKSRFSLFNCFCILVLVITSITGYFLIPQIPVHQVYRAQNLSQLIYALGYILSWPIGDHQFPAFLLWTPALFMILLLTIRKSLTRADVLMTGCFVWSFIQCCAIAYGRGQELTMVSSRYTELFSLGLISNAWFVIRFAEQKGNNLFRYFPAVVFSFVFFYGHLTRINEDMNEIHKIHDYSLLQTRNVCMYLKTNDKTFLDKKGFEIPFPNPVRLKELLDKPSIRKILPDQVKNCQ